MTITQIQPPQQPEYAALDPARAPSRQCHGRAGSGNADADCIPPLVVLIFLDRRLREYLLDSIRDRSTDAQLCPEPCFDFLPARRGTVLLDPLSYIRS